MLTPLNIPPGQYGNGTTYQAKGRWLRSLLVRWFDATLRPMGGWLSHATGLSGKARAIKTWLADNGVPWIGVGTHTNLYAISGGAGGDISDITPVGLVVGYPDATTAGGYGSGDYGDLEYGTPRPDDGSVRPATVWSLDTFGQKLVACNAADGKIYEWDAGDLSVATVIAGAPEGVRSIVVTEEGFLFALGVENNPRVIAWPDQFSLTDWTPGEPSQAGSYSIQTVGKLMAGARVTGSTLIFTDTDVHRATYLGLPFIYSFQRVGTACGLIAQRGLASCGDTLLIWMSDDGFWAFNGVVTPIPCDVGDKVFSDFNVIQKSKVTAYHEPAYGEVTWFYPTATSIENNAYVRYNYRENHWAVGEASSIISRLAATERGGGFTLPFATDADGNVLELESGYTYDGLTPYAESGPIELGVGERSVNVMGLMPDESTLGDVSRTFYAAFNPTAAETTHGPYTSAQPTSVRFQGRQFRVKVEFPNGNDARYGNDRLDLKVGGGRR
jgi:hypothetical protein